MESEAETSRRMPIADVGHPVLVIEDNELNRAVAGRQLGRLGLSHAFAEDGRDGLERAMKEPYAAILTDLSMPVMDGFEFAAKFREWENSAAAAGRERTPVIAVTANVTPDDMARCKEVGMDDFMSKPVTLKRLRETLTKWLAVNPGDTPSLSGPAPFRHEQDNRETSPLPQLAPQSFSALRVIVVEDNETNGMIIRRMLRQLNCAAIDSAADGDQALTTILTAPHGYDLIISDYQMPGMNGLQLLKAVRVGAPGINRDIGFIMLTGFADNFIVGAAFKLDVDSFIVKPVTPRALRARIVHVMTTANRIKRPMDYSEISIDPDEIARPRAPREMKFAAPPWEAEDIDGAGIVERDLSSVRPGSKLARDLYTEAGDLLLPHGQTLDERTLDRLRNISELDASVSRLMVREAAR